MNQAKTFLLMVVLTVILVGLGSMIGGNNGAALAFVVALGINMVSYWFSDRIVLAMYHAQQVSESEAPDAVQYRGDFGAARVAADAEGIYNR